MMESIIKISPYLLAVIIGAAIAVYLYKYLGWKKTIFLAIAAALVDSDHFLFGSKGFLEHPEEGEKILHGFNYGIEFTMIVMLLNVFIGRHLMKTGFKNWLFPSLDKFKSKKYYYFTWAARIILLGMLVHYAVDLPIYLLMDKWGYYDYSIIHYYLTK